MADSNQEEALTRLLQLLRLPSSPEQEAEVMRFLSSNPSLMAAFINHRGQQEQPGDRGVDTGAGEEDKEETKKNEEDDDKDNDNRETTASSEVD